MADRWQDIYGRDASREHGAIAVDPATPPPTSIPRAITPTHERDCSGRHEIDGVLRCPSCRAAGYFVVLHEYKHQDAHFFTTVDPANGSPAWTKDAACRDCRVGFQRE